ncbi:hypothetical protein ACOES3_00275, partial [Candidatus Phytoplasma citri]
MIPYKKLSNLSANSSVFDFECSNDNALNSEKLDSFLYGIKQILITPDLSMTQKLSQAINHSLFKLIKHNLL